LEENLVYLLMDYNGLTLVGFLMLSGRVGDIYGHEKLFITGLLLFSLASLTGGLAPSEIVLILARVVQGLGSAMASATGLSILVAAFAEGKERNRALSVFSAATGSGFCSWNDPGRCDHSKLRMKMGV
jgi:MFS family permease